MSSVEPTEPVAEDAVSSEFSESSVPEEPPPDVLALNLAELRTVEHPVLREVLENLRERAARPGEMLWGFGNSL